MEAERILEVDWEKVDPTGRHRDAVTEALLPLLEKIAREEGCEVLDLSSAVTRLEQTPENEDKGQSCKQKPAEAEHTCPYAEDIAGDSITLCNCCSECEYSCTMDI